jgi:hypothetical protein
MAGGCLGRRVLDGGRVAAAESSLAVKRQAWHRVLGTSGIESTLVSSTAIDKAMEVPKCVE